MITIIIKGTAITMTRAEAVELHSQIVEALWAIAPTQRQSDAQGKGDGQ